MLSFATPNERYHDNRIQPQLGRRRREPILPASRSAERSIVFRLKELCLQENRAPGVAAAAILIGLLFIEWFLSKRRIGLEKELVGRMSCSVNALQLTLQLSHQP
jgi:hypothetical protein